MPPVTTEDPSKRKKKGQLSCAECRRLKLKCDRAFPCSSCRRRGCSSICPDGVLTTGKLGGRFILADTEELHEKVAELQSRIAELEEALANVTDRTVSDTVHPLLRDELLSIKVPLGARLAPDRPQASNSAATGIHEDANHEVVEAMGTLTISEGGIQTFYGTTVGSEFLFEKGDSDDGQDESKLPSPAQESNWLPDHVSHLTHTFPFATLASNVEVVKRQLVMYLPPIGTAKYLSQCFYENGGWTYCPVPRKSFYPHLLDPLYESTEFVSITSHQLAVVFVTLALGVLLDLDRDPYNPEATQYYELSRAALALESPLESTTVAAVQALLLMAFYNQMCDKKTGPTLTWSLNGLAVKLAQSVGLHRDWEKWGLSEDEVTLRRITFWELVCFDSWTAVGFGRPPSQAMQFVDCGTVPDPQCKKDPVLSFHPLKYKFSEILLELVNTTFSATPPTYDQILRLDRLLRDFYIPPLFQVEGINRDDQPLPPHAPESPSLTLKVSAHAIAFLREVALLYMHRSFFARALSEHPDEPFKSRYTASVLACHRSACAVIVLVRKLYAIAPRLLVRFWYFWVHAFTSAVVLASIVTKTPWSNLAPSSMQHIDLICDLFAQAIAGSRPAATLPILIKLRRKAITQYQAFQTGQAARPSVLSRKDGENVTDQLAPMLSGTTRVVAKKKTNPSAFSDCSSTGSGSPSSLPWGMEDVHPNLMEHLKTFKAPQTAYNPTQSMELQLELGPANPRRSARSPPESSPPVAQHALSSPSSNSNPISPVRATSQDMPLVPGPGDPFLQHAGPSWSNYSSPSYHPPQDVYTGGTRYAQAPSSGGLYHYNEPLQPSTQPSSAHQYLGSGGQSSMYQAVAQPLTSNHPYLNERTSLNPRFYFDSESVPNYAPQPPVPVPQSVPQAAVVGGLMHSGGVYDLEQNWRSFLSDIDMPFSPQPPPGPQ